MADRTGEQVGNYRLIRILGRGGFADVYLGEHVHLGSQAAVKVLHAPLTPENMEKFRTEARIIAGLIHPNIVRVLDFGLDKEKGILFLVMDYAPNGSLCQRHPRGIPIPLDIAAHYVKQVAAALQYAHSQRHPNNQRLIHRDVKPENMLVGRNNEILLSDFGIAVVTQTTDPESPQNIAGSVPYMAPEIFEGKPRRASDQYALGIVVYEWLSGSCPFKGSTWEVASQHVEVPPPPLRMRVPSLSPEVERVVLKALAKNPKERFANVQEFAIALEQAYLSSKLTAVESLSAGVLYTHRGHAAPVKSVAWSPDGQRIASASQDGTVQVWDATTGCNALTYTGHRGMVNAVAWSPDGKRIASAGQDGTVQVWDVGKGGQVYTYRGHSSSVTAVTWSPSGELIASASQDRTIQVWNAATGNTYKGHTSDVLAVAWSPDGAYIASGSLDRTVRIWDAASGSIVHIYRDHVEPVNALAWSPDGQRIASAGDDKRVRVRNTSTGQRIFTYRGHANYITALVWSPDGQRIASASYDRTIQVWSAATGTHIFTYHGHAGAVHAVAWNPVWGTGIPNSTHIASASADGTVQVWQVVQ